jgi:hypothetical protein
MTLPDSLTKLSPGWWSAIAAATAAGAALFDGARILGGLACGGAMFYIAKKASGPCCAECADAATKPAAAAVTQPQAAALPFFAPDLSTPAPMPGCVGCELPSAPTTAQAVQTASAVEPMLVRAETSATSFVTQAWEAPQTLVSSQGLMAEPVSEPAPEPMKVLTYVKEPLPGQKVGVAYV